MIGCLLSVSSAPIIGFVIVVLIDFYDHIPLFVSTKMDYTMGHLIADNLCIVCCIKQSPELAASKFHRRPCGRVLSSFGLAKCI